MPAAAFNRDSMAEFYAKRHKLTDHAISEIHYLPTGAPANEIRLVEVNGSVTGNTTPEPIDFGVDHGSDNEHKLVVLDVRPEQWDKIREGALPLPQGWMLEGRKEVSGGRSRKR